MASCVTFRDTAATPRASNRGMELILGIESVRLILFSLHDRCFILDAAAEESLQFGELNFNGPRAIIASWGERVVL